MDFRPLNVCSELQLQISTKNVVKNVTLFTLVLFSIHKLTLVKSNVRFINTACYSLDIFLLTPSMDFQPFNVCSKLQYLVNLLFCWHDPYPVSKTKTQQKFLWMHGKRAILMSNKLPVYLVSYKKQIPRSRGLLLGMELTLWTFHTNVSKLTHELDPVYGKKMKSLVVTFLARLFPKNAISLALMSDFHASVLLMIMNFVITLPTASKIHSYFDNVMTKFIVNNRTDAWKTDVSQLANKLSTLIHWCIALHKL